jgi:uncharacterized damage-inducible protein DinB
MLSEILIEIYERDLNKLKSEIEQYRDEADLWKTDGEILNSAGNLCLHLNGNLQHFFGAVLGETGYVRDRDAEFSRTNVPRDRLLEDISETMRVVRATLEKMSDEEFATEYPIEVFGNPMTTGFFVVHLAAHFNWHLGQIDYHRRLLAAK